MVIQVFVNQKEIDFMNYEDETPTQIISRREDVAMFSNQSYIRSIIFLQKNTVETYDSWMY